MKYVIHASMKLFVLVFAFIAQHSLSAQMTIAQARAQPVGTTVTVKGIVTADTTLYPSSGVTIYFQDNTAGLTAFNTGNLLAPVRMGDSIQITGPLSTFNQLLQISPVNNFTIINTNNPLPAPININLATGFVPANECRLVRVSGVTFTGSGTFSGNTNYNVTDGTSTRPVRINVFTDIPGTNIPGSTVSVTGIMSRFLANQQLLPRFLSDINTGNGPQIVSDITQSNISTTGFDVSFQTQDPGSTLIYYGLTENLGQGPLVNTVLTTQHSATLSGLSAGEIYYVRAASVDALGDTSYSATRVFATQSNSTGLIRTYFITPPDTTVATPGNVAQHTGLSIIDTLIHYINQAEETLDIAIYNWNNNGLPNLAVAINAARNRGVRVRFITCGTTATLGAIGLAANIPQLQSPTTSAYGLMHNKFVVIDAHHSDASRPWVWTGSTNWTLGQVTDDPNNVIIIQDQSLAKAYQLEFEEMWGSGGTQPNQANSKFGPFKTDNTPKLFNVNGKRVELYFSPTDNTEDRIVEQLAAAEYDIEVGTMLMTRNTFAQALVDVHNDNTYVAVVMNDTSNAASKPPYALMASAIPQSRLKIYTIPGIMHHKYAIVDHSAPWDNPRVITGSHNWSNAANTRNDENTIIVYDHSVTNKFFQDWVRIFKNLGGTDIKTIGLAEAQQSKFKTQLYPNPASESTVLKFDNTNSSSAQVKVFDMTGRMVWSLPNALGKGLHYVDIPLHHLKSGIYLVVIEKSQSRETLRLIKR